MNSIKIKGIEIENFKGIQNLKLDFVYPQSDKVLDDVIIYGINGSGKSTILEAIYLCLIVASTYQRSDDLKRIENYLVDYISLGSEWIYHNKEEFILKITIIDNKKSIDATLIYNKKGGLKWKIENNQKFSDDFKKSFTFLSSYRLLNPTTVRTAGDWSEIERIEDDVLRNRARSMRDPRHPMYKNNYFPSLSLQFENNYKTVKQYLVNLITDKKVGAIITN